MATSNTTVANLDHCTECGLSLRVVDGTDPEDFPVDMWEETYECPNGHAGTYRYWPNECREEATGACKAGDAE